METAIDDGRIGDSPLLKDYGEKMATVCQALGIEPDAWQAAGRTREGRFFWTVQETEADCRSFVDRVDDKLSHLIFGQYPELSDAWALEAIRAAADCGVPCELRYDSGIWLFRFWSTTWGWLTGLPGSELGAVVCSGLSHAIASGVLGSYREGEPYRQARKFEDSPNRG